MNKEEKLARDNRKLLVERLTALFPEEPHCINGTWSWSGQAVDIVFPELTFQDKNTKRFFVIGVAIHSIRPGDNQENLIKSCIDNEVPLLLLDYKECPSASELVKRIEKIFQDTLSVVRP